MTITLQKSATLPSAEPLATIKMTEEELQKMWILRKILHPMDTVEAAEFLIERLRFTKTNDEFFDSMKQKK